MTSAKTFGFLAPISIGVHEIEGELSLAGEGLEALKNASQGRDRTVEICSRISEVADPRVDVGIVLEQTGPGIWTKHFSATLVSTARLTATLGTMVAHSSTVSDAERKKLEDEQREREYQQLRRRVAAWVVAADRNPAPFRFRASLKVI